MKLTILLISIMLIVFAAEVFLIEDLDGFFNQYGFSGENLFSRPWVLVTSIFVHGDLVHILSNIAVMFFFGSAIEGELGNKRFLLVFFLGAFAGDIFSLFFYPFDTVGIGASAGIFALIGVGMIVKPFDLSFYPYFLPVPLGLLGIIYAVYNAIGFVSGPSNISYVAHFGGLFVGLLFGFRQEGWKRGIGIVILMIAIMLMIPLVLLVLT